LAVHANRNDIAAIKDIFVSTGASWSGAAKAVLTFDDPAPATALYEVARTSFFFFREQEGGGRKRYWNSVKWWVRNFRYDEQSPASGY
jgi:hypothetical protein